MSRICPLFSGSKGNSTYIGTSCGGILVDAGASMKGIKEAISLSGGDVSEIKAIAITHEHSDHIRGLKTFLNKTDASLIASHDTINTLLSLGLIPEKTNIIEIDKKIIDIDGIKIKRFPTKHDCKGSSGYSFMLPDGKKVSVCTDLGVVTEEVKNSLIGSDLVLIESNHDIEMLKKGPYPYELKVRILSDNGHLSNNICSSFIAELYKTGTKRFILGHLSLNNNTCLIAKASAESALMDLGAKNGKDYILSVANEKNNGVTVI